MSMWCKWRTLPALAFLEAAFPKKGRATQTWLSRRISPERDLHIDH